MHARLRIDLEGSDLAAAARALVAPGDAESTRARVEAHLDRGAPALACLSVRSGLDLYLTALALPRGSEVLVSALSIRGMLDVIAVHGLVAVPLDVELGDVMPRPATLRAAAGPRARLVLVAQLFGARAELDGLLDEAERLGLPLIEDCAQAWLGDGYAGHPRAAAAFFSFGFIKTATALGGALVVVRDAELCDRMRDMEAAWPTQSSAVFARRLARAAAFSVLAPRGVYALFTSWCRLRGRDLDALLHGSVRGFSERDLLTQLSHRPPAPMLALLDRRLARDAPGRLTPRRDAGARLAEHLTGVVPMPGRAAPTLGDWVFPVLAPDPDALVRALRAASFDATRVSSLVAVEPPPDRPQLAPRNARALLEQVVFLPAGAHVPLPELDRQAELVRALIRSPQRAAS